MELYQLISPKLSIVNPPALLIAKLHSFWTDFTTLKLLHSYLTKRKHRLKLKGTYSSWSEIISRVPQGSILGPLLFNIFLCNLFQFFSDQDITNYADDNTPHSTKINLNKVLHDLENMLNISFKWFTDNLLQTNPPKSHLLTNSKHIDEMVISNSKYEKLLRIYIDNKVTFEHYVRYLRKKTSQKLNHIFLNHIHIFLETN